jgi:hypothetical protein
MDVFDRGPIFPLQYRLNHFAKYNMIVIRTSVCLSILRQATHEARMFPDSNKGEEPLACDKDPQPDTVPRDEASVGDGCGATENAEANIGSANFPAIGSSSRDCEEPAVTTPDPVATSAGGAVPAIDVPDAPARRPIFDPDGFISVPGAPAPGPIFPSENEIREKLLLLGGAVDLDYVSPWLLELIPRSVGLSSLDVHRVPGWRVHAQNGRIFVSASRPRVPTPSGLGQVHI